MIKMTKLLNLNLGSLDEAKATFVIGETLDKKVKCRALSTNNLLLMVNDLVEVIEKEND